MGGWSVLVLMLLGRPAPRGSSGWCAGEEEEVGEEEDAAGADVVALEAGGRGAGTRGSSLMLPMLLGGTGRWCCGGWCTGKEEDDAAGAELVALEADGRGAGTRRPSVLLPLLLGGTGP